MQLRRSRGLLDLLRQLLLVGHEPRRDALDRRRARICAASTPALVAPGLPIDTVATGTPGGICTVDSSASMPLSADESIGTPMTGSVVCAATTPREMCGGAGADDEDLARRGRARRATSRITRSGDRCAEATVISHGNAEFTQHIDGRPA